MARKRKEMLGLPIGPEERPLRLGTATKIGAVTLAAASAAVGAKRMADKRSDEASASILESSPEARARAIKASAKARTARSRFQRRLKSGSIDLAQAFERADREDAIGRTRVKVLLQSLPGVGPAGAVKAMEEVGIDPGRRVKGLGERQRTDLLDRFGTNGRGN